MIQLLHNNVSYIIQEHIKNSLALLKRNGVTKVPYEMLRELHQRGDE